VSDSPARSMRLAILRSVASVTPLPGNEREEWYSGWDVLLSVLVQLLNVVLQDREREDPRP